MTNPMATADPNDMEEQAPDETTGGPNEEVGEGLIDRVAELQSQAETLQAQVDEYLDKYRRSLAEFSNYRKRQERERQQQAWRIQADVIRAILPALDDFRLALEHVPAEHAESPWVQGIALIERKLLNVLAQFDVTPIEAQGQPFDPHFHDAMLQEPSDVYDEGVVMEEIRKGYLMNDQVLRPTVVKVSQGAPQPEQ
jgi:molecular chaperone GrpE